SLRIGAFTVAVFYGIEITVLWSFDLTTQQWHPPALCFSIHAAAEVLGGNLAYTLISGCYGVIAGTSLESGFRYSRFEFGGGPCASVVQLPLDQGFGTAT